MKSVIENTIKHFFEANKNKQVPLIQNIMNVDVIGQVPLVTKIVIGMLCVFNLTNSNSAITALTHNQTKVSLFVP